MDIESSAASGIGDAVALLESDLPLDPKTSQGDESEVKQPTDEEVIGDEDLEEKPKVEEGEEEEHKETEVLGSRPTLPEIKAKYPNLFKDFPALRDVYFREREYSELFPSVEDAREASLNNDAFSSIREGVLSGDVSNFLSAVREIDALDKISDNLLPSLYKASPDAHWRATTPLMENIVRSFFNEGTLRESEDLQNAALHLSHYLFNDSGAIAKGEKTLRPAQVPNEEKVKLENDRKEFETQRFTSFHGDVASEAQRGLKDLILERGQHNKLKMDPDGQLSEFMKNTLVEKIAEEVGKQMSSDKTHMSLVNSLWARAKKAGYQGDWKSRILSAYLARAKSLVGPVRSRLVSEALGTTTDVGIKKAEKVAQINGRKEPGQGGRNALEAPKTYDAKKIDWSRTSEDDFLNDNITLKR
jgi:hypothetical protein